MRRAIRNHRVDFLAIVVLVALAVLVTGYILKQQPAFHFGVSYYTVKAAFSEASAVESGQGQAVTIAGVQVGQVGGIALDDGHAVVTMNIDEKYAPIYRNATVLLRPRTPLKDMYLSLDPGSRGAGRLPAGATLPVSQTNPDVDVSEILSSLDSDTRNYLLLLLAGGAGAFRDGGRTTGGPTARAVSDLQQTFKRFAPLNRDTRTFASLLARRQSDLRRSVHNLSLVAGALGGVDGQLASLIDASDADFSQIAANDRGLQDTLSQFPATLRQTQATLPKVQRFAVASTGTLHKLQPFARALAPALRSAQPLFHDTTPVVATELRPFARAVQPLARTLRPASASLRQAAPKLASSVGVLNSLVNELAYTAKGQQSFLFYGSWLAHIVNSIVSVQDANGATAQGLFFASCAQLNFYEKTLAPNDQPLGVIIDLLGLPDIAKIPGAKPPTIKGFTSYTCPQS